MTHHYPPPWQDAPTLCRNICVSERTLDAWVREGKLPAPRQIGGKRMWKWSEVEARLEGATGIVPGADGDIAARVFNATKQAANR